ncbi:hypothetical protein EV122DRAFT_252095, partial [Schizophyllum commune]
LGSRDAQPALRRWREGEMRVDEQGFDGSAQAGRICAIARRRAASGRYCVVHTQDVLPKRSDTAYVADALLLESTKLLCIVHMPRPKSTDLPPVALVLLQHLTNIVSVPLLRLSELRTQVIARGLQTVGVELEEFHEPDGVVEVCADGDSALISLSSYPTALFGGGTVQASVPGAQLEDVRVLSSDLSAYVRLVRRRRCRIWLGTVRYSLSGANVSFMVLQPVAMKPQGNLSIASTAAPEGFVLLPQLRGHRKRIGPLAKNVLERGGMVGMALLGKSKRMGVINNRSGTSDTPSSDASPMTCTNTFSMRSLKSKRQKSPRRQSYRPRRYTGKEKRASKRQAQDMVARSLTWHLGDLMEDSAWRDFLAQELQDLARTRPAIMDADLETLKAIMEARYTLLLADAGIHGDSILSSVDENAAGYRRRILVRFYCPGEHLPEVVTLWKTAGWVILSHFEMTLQSLRLRERLSKPHILLRNGAVSAVDWDSRIPVAGEELNVYGEYRASALEGRQFKCQIELSVEGDNDVVVMHCSAGGWIMLKDALSLMRSDLLSKVDVTALKRRVPENGQLVSVALDERIAVAEQDTVHVSCVH